MWQDLAVKDEGILNAIAQCARQLRYEMDRCTTDSRRVAQTTAIAMRHSCGVTTCRLVGHFVVKWRNKSVP